MIMGVMRRARHGALLVGGGWVSNTLCMPAPLCCLRSSHDSPPSGPPPGRLLCNYYTMRHDGSNDFPRHWVLQVSGHGGGSPPHVLHKSAGALRMVVALGLLWHEGVASGRSSLLKGAAPQALR